MASQNYGTNHNHLQLHQPSTSSNSPRGIGSSLSLSSSSSLLSSTSMMTSPPQISINAGHYSMLINNDIHDLLEDISSQGDDFDLSHLVESDNSTMLHLAASTSQLCFINCIIQNKKELLLCQNFNDDLAIHVAAKSCQFEAVEKLVSWANQHRYCSMLETVNKEKNTALHIALENHHKKMAVFLFDNCPKTFYFVNEQGFSPLYLAIKAEFWDLAIDMLNTEAEEAEEKLLEGRSVVHAAIVAKRKDIFERMVDKYNDLQYKKPDELGRRPLSYAAYTGFLDGVNYILNDRRFKNQPFKIDDDENRSFPIHWACEGGDIKVVEAFFSSLPKKTRFLLNKKGQNILHVAAASGKTKIVKFILGHLELEMMINMKDEDGNTPLHLAAKGKHHPRVVYLLTWDKRVKFGVQNKNGLTALDIAEDYEDQVPSFDERLTWLSLRYAGVPRAPKLHYLKVDIIVPDMANRSYQTPLTNNRNATPTNFMLPDQQVLLDLIKDHPKIKRKIKYKERINTLLVVATLVATVTFASGFTVPGGYNNNKPEGLATLAHKAFFQVFVISNTIAMYSSILSLVTLIWAHLDDTRLVLVSLDFALPLLGIALVMMSVAFTAALYVVVHGIVSWLSVVVLIMGGMFLVAFMIFFLPLYSPTSCIRNKVFRCICHFPFTLMLLACEKGKSR